MILSGPTIRAKKIITPHEPRSRAFGMTYGESLAGYDIRLGEDVTVSFGQPKLSVSLEYFDMPRHVVGFTFNKSSLARQHIYVPQTVLEPGWQGFLTLEIHIVSDSETVFLDIGTPIAQVVFHRLDRVTEGYTGKYQNQPNEAVEARFEDDDR